MFLSVNILTEIYTPNLPTVVVQSVAPDMQTTDSVVNIYDPGYFSETSNGVDLYRISRRIYQQFGDVYDMLNLVTAADYIENHHHVVVRNNVQGIGIAIMDNRAGTGNDAQLLGFDVFPSSVFFDGADHGYSHEFGHQWIQYMRVVPFESGIPHWPISSLASGVMGFSLPPSAEGGDYNCKLVSEAGGVRLQPDNNPKTFTDFDLYMMGLLGKDQVGEHIIFDNQNDPTIRQCNGQLYTGAITRVHTSDVVAAFGGRVPDVTSSRKAFRVGTVVISPDGLLSPEAMMFYTFFANRAEATQPLATHIGLVKHMDNPFAVATGNRASLTTAWVTIEPGALPDADFALHYSQTLSQSGLLGAPIWSINAGALPPGLELNAASGVLSGIPTVTGTFNFTVRVTGDNYFSEHAYSVHVGFRPVITAVSPTPNIVGNLITYSASVKPNVVSLPHPTGTVQFKLDGNAIGNAIPLVNGAARLTLTAPPTGVYSVSVSYSGDSNYLAGSRTANAPLIIFQISVRDDRSGNYVLFNATAAPNLPAGAFYLNSCSPWVPPAESARSGIGVILS